MRFLLRRGIQVMTVVVLAAGMSLVGGAAAHAGSGYGCYHHPYDYADNSKELILCSEVRTYVSNGVKYADGRGDVTIGSSWYTSATDCMLTSWLTLSNGSASWNTSRVSTSCWGALRIRNATVWGYWVSTPTTATQVLTWTCVDLYFNSTSSGWQRCTYSPVRYW